MKTRIWSYLAHFRKKLNKFDSIIIAFKVEEHKLSLFFGFKLKRASYGHFCVWGNDRSHLTPLAHMISIIMTSWNNEDSIFSA